MGFSDFLASLFRGAGSLAPPPKPPRPPTWSATCAFCGASLRLTGPPDGGEYFCSTNCEHGWETGTRQCAVCRRPAVDGELCMMCAEMWYEDYDR